MAYSAEVETAWDANPTTRVELASGGDIAAELAGGKTVIKLQAGTYAGFTVSSGTIVMGGAYTTVGTPLVTITSIVTVGGSNVSQYDLNLSKGIAITSGGTGYVRGSIITATAAALVTVTSGASAAALTLVSSTVGGITSATDDSNRRILINGATASVVLTTVTFRSYYGLLYGIEIMNGGSLTGTTVNCDQCHGNGSFNPNGFIYIATGGGTVDITDLSIQRPADYGNPVWVSGSGASCTLRGVRYSGNGDYAFTAWTGSTLTILPFLDNSPSTILCSAGDIALYTASATVTVKRTDITGCTYVYYGGGTLTLNGVTIHDLTPTTVAQNIKGRISLAGSLTMDVYVGSDGRVYPNIIRDIGGMTYSGAGIDAGVLYLIGNGPHAIYGTRFLRCSTAGVGKGGAIYFSGNAGTTLTVGKADSETATALTGEDGVPMTTGWDVWDSGRVDQGGVEISGCSAYRGGGIYCPSSNFTITIVNTRITTCDARDTTALTDLAGGGGICMENLYGTVKLMASLIDHCTTAGSAGGGVHFAKTTAGGSFTMRKCTFAYNSAATGGGHLYCGGDADSATVVKNCIFYGATAGYGIYLKAGGPTLSETVDLFYQNTPAHRGPTGAPDATSFVDNPLWLAPAALDLAAFREYRPRTSSRAATSGTRLLDYVSLDPFLDQVIGCSGSQLTAALFTGDKEVDTLGWNRDSLMTIVHDVPLPFTLLAAMMVVEFDTD